MMGQKIVIVLPECGPAPVVTASGNPTDYNISQFKDWGAAYDGSTRGPAGMTRNMTPNVRGGPAPQAGVSALL
jgi:hypothetical protein